MVYFVLGAIALFIALVGANAFVNANPQRLAAGLRLVGGVALLAVAAVLALTGRWAFAIPAAAFGLSLLGWRSVPGFGPAGGASRPSAGQQSRVRSAALEMVLDHETGAMTGEVIAGRFEGQPLEDLSRQDLVSLMEEISSDAESLALLEAYLDRREPGWREDFEADSASGQSAASGAGPMTDEEAYQVLGLSPGATEAEVREAHRRLMKRMHPDQGGTTFLAAKINEAKDRLLRSHGPSDTHY